MAAPPPFGVYSPMVTFFNDDETIDFESITSHIQRLVAGGVAGLVIHGSNGEATHLLHEERAEIIAHTRKVFTEQGRPDLAIIAGCSANSVRETLLYISEAKAAGANYALVLPPNYWAAAMSKPVITRFYTEISSKSELPIVIYNFPNVTAGIDLDSDLIISLATTCSNIVGVKLTCGNTGKLQRISSSLKSSDFAPFAGKADFVLPGLLSGGNGAISALANVVPKAHVEVLRLYEEGKLAEAQKLQGDLAQADWAMMKLGLSGVKAAVVKYFGYGDVRARSPLPTAALQAFDGEIGEKLRVVVDLEKSL